MRVVSLELRNIRSYKHETIRFPEGLVLLAGDIGSGKSTLLLALEFALFGIRRGEVTGTTLLRHGAREGDVTLTLELPAAGGGKGADQVCTAGRELVIKRGLKRTSQGVGQDTGYILFAGAKEELSPVELTAKILSILGYPESLRGNSRSLVFRYTVYTPQEQMKQILFEKSEERLDTLRKLFDLDKYKIIRENASLYARDVRARAERLKGQADDLPELEKELKQSEVLVKTAKEAETKAAAAIKVQEPIAKKARDSLTKLEQERFALAEFQKQTAVMKTRVERITHDIKELSTEEERLENEIAKLKLPEHAELEAREKRLVAALQRKDETREPIEQNTANLAKLDLMLEQSEKIVSAIADLTTCPTCKQKVDAQHKSAIKKKEDEKSSTVKKKRELILAKIAELREKSATFVQEQGKIRRELTEVSELKAKLGARDVQRERLKSIKRSLEQQRAEHEKLSGELVAKEKLLAEKSKSIDEDALAEAREILAREEGRVKELAVTLARAQEQAISVEKKRSELAERIEKKRRSLAAAERLGKTHVWVTKHFTNLMFTIEKHILMSLYHQFNDAFREWFDTLIEDEAISVSLSPEFAPQIEQDGYETEVSGLSGGEKTSVALAYRLALNNVVNKALGHLATSDLLILDEPTDGFSSEQLDRVQELLSRLGLGQVLVVSHEPKMESFVDHVVRVVKSEHESKVLA